MQLNMKPVLGPITENKGGIFREELISREPAAGGSVGRPLSCPASHQHRELTAPLPLCVGVPRSANPWRQRSPALPLQMTQWGKDLGRIAFLSILFFFLLLGFLEDRKRGLFKSRLGWVSSCSDVVGPCLKDSRVQ